MQLSVLVLANSMMKSKYAEKHTLKPQYMTNKLS